MPKLIRQISENIWQCAQVWAEGTAGTLLSNLKQGGVSRGLTLWARWTRDFYGELGPRILQLCDGIFSPEKASGLEKVAEACASHEAHILKMEEMDRETTLLLCQMWGLLKALPDSLRSSCVDHFAEFKNKDGKPSYQKAQRYILDQVALRRKEAGSNRQPPLQALE